MVFILFWYLASILPRKKEHIQSRLSGGNDTISEMSESHFLIPEKNFKSETFLFTWRNIDYTYLKRNSIILLLFFLKILIFSYQERYTGILENKTVLPKYVRKAWTLMDYVQFILALNSL